MKIEFDPTKDAANLRKHGLSLALAGSLERDLARVTEDTREPYGEQRFIGFAPIGEDIHCVAFTECDDCYRIISLRTAEKHEVKRYVRHI